MVSASADSQAQDGAGGWLFAWERADAWLDRASAYIYFFLILLLLALLLANELVEQKKTHTLDWVFDCGSSTGSPVSGVVVASSMAPKLVQAALCQSAPHSRTCEGRRSAKGSGSGIWSLGSGPKVAENE